MKTNLNILYEDNHLIVIIKPINILSQADNTKDIDMLTIIKDYLKEKYQKKGNVYLGLVHRLDRPTGGIMVFAKTSKAAKRLSEAIKNRLVVKKYLAVVRGVLPKSGVLKDYLKKDEDHKAIITNEDDGKLAILSYEVIDVKDDLSLVSVTLETGRHHQIRAQFSNINHPLYGDQKYGIIDKKQLALYAYYLAFFHPVTKTFLEFKNYPKGDIWDIFNYKEDVK